MVWTPLAMFVTLTGAGVAVAVWLRRHPSDFANPPAARMLSGIAMAAGVVFSVPMLLVRVQGPNAAADPISAFMVVGSLGIGVATFTYLRSLQPELPVHHRGRLRTVAAVAGLLGLLAFVAGMIALFTVLPG